MKSALLLACVLFLPLATIASANEEGGDGVYQRQRQQQRMQDGWQGYGGNFYGNPYYGGYFGGYYYQPQIYGSWYARPYPTHLDYFRLRSRTPSVTPAADAPKSDSQ